MKKLHLAAVALALFNASAASADDGGLYPAAVDPTSSFVRVVAPGQSFATINGTKIASFVDGVSAFVNVMPGAIDVVLPSETVAVEVGKSAYYTVIIGEDGENTVITDNISNSPAKADISFYNLTKTENVTLFVPAADTAAVDDLGSMAAKTVALRAPLTLDFEVRNGADVVAEVSQVALQRGTGVAIVLVENGDGYAASVIPNTYFK